MTGSVYGDYYIFTVKGEELQADTCSLSLEKMLGAWLSHASHVLQVTV